MYTVVQFILSGDDDYLMIETCRKPTTVARCPTLFSKWHGILYMPRSTDTARHTKAFDYPVIQTKLDIPRPLITQSHRQGPVAQTRLDIPRPLITQSHRHGWAYQDYPVAQTRLDIPRPLITQSHRHGWAYQGL